MRPAARLAVFAALLVLVVVLAFASICVGTVSVPLAEVTRAFTAYDPTDNLHITVRDIRLPRTFLAAAVGAALAVSGALIQTMTRNPLAEPGILGITAGAGFALTAAAAYGSVDGQLPQMLCAFAGALGAVLLVYAVGRTSPLHLLLAGTALSALLMGINLGIRLMDSATLDKYRFWSVGSLAGREQIGLTAPIVLIVVCLIGAVILTRSLSALTLGEQVATTLGIRVGQTRGLVILLVTVLTATATAVAGPIAFVGLIVPHLVRRISSGSVGWLIAFSLVGGPVLMILSDILARVLLPTGEVPVAIVTAFLGAPMLVWVVRRYGVAPL